MGFIQPSEALTRKKKNAVEGRIPSLCLTAVLIHRTSALGLGLEFTPPIFLILRPLDSDWSNTTNFPGSPANRQELWAFSAYLIMSINFYNEPYVYLSPIGCVSLQNPNIYISRHILFTTESVPCMSACSIYSYGFPLNLCCEVFFSKI